MADGIVVQDVVEFLQADCLETISVLAMLLIFVFFINVAVV